MSRWDSENSTATKKRTNFTNLYVKNFGREIDETKLCQLFSVYGVITSCKIPTDNNGDSRGFGFVNFERPEMAQNAAEKLNGYRFDDGKYLYVARFQKKSERQNELRQTHIENQNKRSNNLCLYVSNLDIIVDEKLLEAVFSQFGRVTKTHILRNGFQSKGIGFVSFDTMEETAEALNEMNGKWILSKPIYVKLSRNNDHSQLITPNSPTSSIPSANVTYPMPYQNIPPMFYVPTIMIPHLPNNFPLPIRPPNLRAQSIREYASPPPPLSMITSSTATRSKRPFYPYTPVKSDEQ